MGSLLSLGNPFFLVLHAGNILGSLRLRNKLGLTKRHVILTTILNFIIAWLAFGILFSQFYYSVSEALAGTGTDVAYGVYYEKQKYQKHKGEL